eukprot:2462267-Rhodomonas_salina.1
MFSEFCLPHGENLATSFDAMFDSCLSDLLTSFVVQPQIGQLSLREPFLFTNGTKHPQDKGADSDTDFIVRELAEKVLPNTMVHLMFLGHSGLQGLIPVSHASGELEYYQKFRLMIDDTSKGIRLKEHQVRRASLTEGAQFCFTGDLEIWQMLLNATQDRGDHKIVGTPVAVTQFAAPRWT